MLAEHAKLWFGDIGTIRNTVRRIEIIPGAQPLLQMPYRQGSNGQLIEKKEVNRILKAGVIKPSYSDWSSTVVLVP